MRQRHILLSGDYWHSDFQAILSTLDVPVTMLPVDKLDRFEADASQFDLIVLAESRPDQIKPDTVEILREKFAGIPIVNLLGSWCEGETRSGSPLPGVIRVYWHQWNGQYAKFVGQLRANQISDWHQPLTSTTGDRMLASKFSRSETDEMIGVSAWTQTQFEMLADSLKTLGYRTRWLERSIWDAEAIKLLSAICIDATSVTHDLIKRVHWLRATFPETPMILVLNFPRTHDRQAAKELGIAEVISKPYELADLLAAVMRVLGEHAQRENESWIQ